MKITRPGGKKSTKSSIQCVVRVRLTEALAAVIGKSQIEIFLSLDDIAGKGNFCGISLGQTIESVYGKKVVVARFLIKNLDALHEKIKEAIETHQSDSTHGSVDKYILQIF